MAKLFLPRHGKTHAEDGSDPIPIGSGDLDQTIPYQPTNVLLSDAFGQFDVDWGAVTLDATVYGGGVRAVNPVAVGKWVAFPCVMGPKGSVWGITVVQTTGPAFGIATIEYATSSQDGLVGAVGFEGPGFMQQPDDVTFVSTTYTIDGYAAGATPDVVVQRQGVIRIGGDPGDVLTAFGTDPVNGEKLGDGGPGLYWVRLNILTKNASSTNYGFNLQYLAVERIPGG